MGDIEGGWKNINNVEIFQEILNEGGGVRSGVKVGHSEQTDERRAVQARRTMYALTAFKVWVSERGCVIVCTLLALVTTQE